MKKVIALIGSARKQATYQAVRVMEENLKAYGDIDFEYVFLKDCCLENCVGCKLCFDRGEEYCPAKDDRDMLIEKMERSDGVIFATPNYAFHISASMKNLFDRMAFLLHRPRFFGKSCTTVVAQGIFGGASIVKYLNTMGENLGFCVSRGCVVKALEPGTEKDKKRNVKEINKASARFYKELIRSAPKAPSIFRLMLFRMSRTNIRMMLDEKYRDYRYFRERGWFTSEYYHDASMGLFRRLAGRFFDFVGRRMAL